MEIFRYLALRLKEKSSWAGIIPMLGLLGYGTEQVDTWVVAVTGVIAFCLVIWPEKKPVA